MGGIIIGALYPSEYYSAAGELMLYALLFIIGISVGFNTETLKKAVHVLDRRMLLLPAFSIAGAMLGGALAGLIFGLPLKISLAIAAGMGWYSLAGPMLSVVSPIYGSIAFLGNIGRELLTFLTVPLKKTGPMESIAMGGATAMDTTMPVITESTGREYVLACLYNGMILSSLVPLLIGMMLSLP